jgi:hypothetical protein
MPEIRYRESGEYKEHVIYDLPFSGHLCHLKQVAKYIAKKEYDEGDFSDEDPYSWPRVYEIFRDDKWEKVSVDVKFQPIFSCTCLA